MIACWAARDWAGGGASVPVFWAVCPCTPRTSERAAPAVNPNPRNVFFMPRTTSGDSTRQLALNAWNQIKYHRKGYTKRLRDKIQLFSKGYEKSRTWVTSRMTPREVYSRS